MRVAYCTNVRLPSERAHGHQIAQVCDALVSLGHQVTVFATIREETIQESFASYYGVSGQILLKHIGFKKHIPNWPPLRPLRLAIQNRGMIRDYKTELTKDRFDLLYTRTPALLATLIATGIPVILELHQLPRRGRSAFVRHCNACKLVVCLTERMRQELGEWGVHPARMTVEGDAVDIDRFRPLPKKSDARIQVLVAASDRFVVGYTGSIITMGHDKGVGLIADAVSRLRSQKLNISKLIAGGPDNARMALQRRDDHPEEYMGHQPHARIKWILAACDVLVYPAPASDHPYFTRYTSPLKIFEYMTACRPIIAADIPPVRDILDETSAYFFRPGDAADLARVIEHIMQHPEEAKKKAVEAADRVMHHTWEERMKRILSKEVMM